jgi:CheY-like chemotaxis protein
MDSRFYYPTNTGSLGESRRPRSLMRPNEPQLSTRFAPGPGWHPGSEPILKPAVLVVEDDDDSLFIMRRLLEKKGYQVLEAYDGRQALEIAETTDLDLILLDLQLPRMNGLGVIHRLRENPELESVPIVIMTGYEPERYRDSAIAAGCDDFVLKPIDFERLDAILDYYVPIVSIC